MSYWNLKRGWTIRVYHFEMNVDSIFFQLDLSFQIDCISNNESENLGDKKMARAKLVSTFLTNAPSVVQGKLDSISKWLGSPEKLQWWAQQRAKKMSAACLTARKGDEILKESFESIYFYFHCIHSFTEAQTSINYRLENINNV